MALTTRLRSVLNDACERATGTGTDEGPVSGHTRAGNTGPHASPNTTLFECPACENVYVAVEKSTCSDCDTPVEEVAATLSDDPET